MAIGSFAGQITPSIAIDVVSVISVLVTMGIFLYIVMTHFKGMRAPPFWLYFIFGFVIVMVQGMIASLEQFQQYSLYLSLMNMVGSLFMLYGVTLLLKTFSSRIKYDRKIKR